MINSHRNPAESIANAPKSPGLNTPINIEDVSFVVPICKSVHCLQSNDHGSHKGNSCLVEVTMVLKNFINVIDNYPQDLVPMVDLEQNDKYTKKKYVEELNKFLILLENHFNQKPIIYSVTNFYNQYLSNNFLEYKLFLGFYNLEHEKISLKDKRDWDIWQFSQQGKIKGISKNVDINVLNKKIQLKDLLLK